MELVQLISDVLLTLAALGAGGYCFVLSRRLRSFNQLETGMGGAIAVLSAQVDDMTRALDRAQATATASEAQLATLVQRAEKGAERLELMLAALHDLPSEEPEHRRRVLRRRPRSEDWEAAE